MGSIFKDNQAYENNEERFKELEARKCSIQDNLTEMFTEAY